MNLHDPSVTRRKEVLIMDPKDCLFCKIISGEFPSKKVYEDGSTFVILDINPRNPGHMLVMTKKHYETIFEVPGRDAEDLFRTVKNMAGRCRSGVNADGVSICQSNGAAAGQMVRHVHVHVIPRFKTEGPPGLEVILPVKRMDDAGLDRIVKAIQGSEAEDADEEPEAAEEETPDEKKAEGNDEEEIDFKF
jgi:histidine triad (HIT) family protein